MSCQYPVYLSATLEPRHQTYTHTKLSSRNPAAIVYRLACCGFFRAPVIAFGTCRVFTTAPTALHWLKRPDQAGSPSVGALGLNDGSSPASLVQQMSLQPQAHEPASAAQGSGITAPGGLWLTSDVDAPLMLANLRESMTLQPPLAGAQHVRSPPDAQHAQLPALLSSPKPAGPAMKGVARLAAHASLKMGAATAELSVLASPRQAAASREARHRAPVKGRNDSKLLRGSDVPGPQSKASLGRPKATAAAVVPRRRKP